MHLLDLLCCPSCGGTLGWARRCPSEQREIYGILRCNCHAYPVVAGIPVMKRDGTEELLEALREDRCREAFLRALNTRPRSHMQGVAERSVLSRIPGMKYQLRSFLERRRFDRAHRLRAALEQGAPFREVLHAAYAYPGKPHVADYFYYKFGQPRHLGALAWVPTLLETSGMILDFACGPGHLVWTLTRNGAAGRVVGADLYFKSVYLASRLAGPDAAFVCCSADHGLPFRDGAFDGIIAADALHVVSYPVPCLRELRRALSEDGLLVATSIPNSQARNRVAHLGNPPPPASWGALLPGMQTRLLCCRDVVDRYLHGEGPDTQHSISSSEWFDSPIYSVIASRGSHWFRRPQAFARWPHACGNVVVNPLYRHVKGAEYRLTVPSPQYDEENAFAWTYMPGSVVLPRGGPAGSDLSALVAQWVVVGAPDNYGAEAVPGLPSDTGEFYVRPVGEPAQTSLEESVIGAMQAGPGLSGV